MDNKCYVVVYIGYEGIDHILWATQSGSEAVDKVKEFRAIAEENQRLSDEERYKKSYPEMTWYEPDRVCVMSRRENERVYGCCCRELALEVKTPIYY